MSFPLRNLKKKSQETEDDPKRAGAVAPGAASGVGGSSGAASGGFGFGSAGSSGLAGSSSASGSGLISSLGTAAPTGAGSASGWSSIVGAISKATGLSAVAASKAGIVGIVLAVSSGVAGVSLWMGNSTPTGERTMKRRVFALNSESQETTSARAVKAARGEGKPGAASSLEYTPKLAENLPEATPTVDGPANEIAPPSREEIAAATEKVVDAPVAKKSKPRRVPPGDVPKLAKRSAPSTRSSNQTTKVSLKALDGLAGGVGSGFQQIYKAANSEPYDGVSQKRARYGANRKTVALNSGGSAMAQAKFAGRMSRGATRMGRTSGASHTAALPFDGANASARSLGKSEGTGLGGTGLAGSASSALDSKVIDPPPPPEDIKKGEDKTPYQGLLYAAMGALGLGTLLLMAAGKMISQGRSQPGPQGAAMLAQGKALAMAAMGAGGAAAGMGAMIAGEHGQMTQGMPFLTGGGILALQAGMVLAKADAAGEEASSGIENAAGQAAQTAGQALQGMNQQKPSEEPKKKEAPERRDVNVDYSKPGYQGDINIPGL